METPQLYGGWYGVHHDLDPARQQRSRQIADNPDGTRKGGSVILPFLYLAANGTAIAVPSRIQNRAENMLVRKIGVVALVQ
jgi:hypothetical protein